MSSSRKAFGGLFWTISANMLNAAYGLVCTPILLRHFGKEEFGLIGLATQVNFWLVLLDFGLANGNIRFFSQWIVKKQYDRVSKLFQSSLLFYGIIGIINAVILAVFVILSQSLWHLNAENTVIMHHLFYILIGSAFIGWIDSLFDQFLKANEIIGWEERLMIFVKMLQILALYLTVTLGFSVTMYFLLSTLAYMFIFPITIVKIRRLDYKVSFMPKYHAHIFKHVFPYSLNVFVITIFQFSATNVRPLLLSFRAGVSPFADYRIISAFAVTIMALSTNFVGVLLPMATRAVTLGNAENRSKIAYDATKYLTIFLSVIVFGFVLISKDVLCLYVGDKYAYLDIWLKLWILTMLFSHNSAISSLVFAENKLRPVAIISAFSCITSLALAWFLVPRFQVGGVILSYLYYCISQISFYYSYYYPRILKLDVRRILSRSFFTPAFGLFACAATVYLLVPLLDLHSRIARILVTGSFFTVIAFFVIFFVLLSFEDKKFIRKLLTRRKAAEVQA
jgi:O-antigen/teichoic acid export membrane protein